MVIGPFSVHCCFLLGEQGISAQRAAEHGDKLDDSGDRDEGYHKQAQAVPWKGGTLHAFFEYTDTNQRLSIGEGT